MKFIDIVVDLQYGDSGKGKVTHHLLKSGEYTHCIRYNGGCNCGHTLIHNGKKFITHHLPAGVLYPGVKSIIGPGCVVNVEQFMKECNEVLDTFGISPIVYIAKNTHIITQAHKDEDGKDIKIGTTKSGNGPAYRDKYSRVGIRAEDVPELKPYLIDLYEELHILYPDATVIAEGAQGFGLDIDWGDYPYVTSSSCTVGACLLNGIPYNKIRNVWGLGKVYETYVGTKKFEGDDLVFQKIRELGGEFGATTGRPRQVNWLDINLLMKATTINGVDKIVLNKADILNKLGVWNIRGKFGVMKFDNEEQFKEYLRTKFKDIEIIFSYSPEEI